MSTKELDKLLWKERVNRVLLWGFSILIVVLIYGGIGWLRTPPSDGIKIEEVYGKVVTEPTQGVNFYNTKYKVQLENGLVVKADGFGKVPNRYRGRVKLKLINSGGGDYYQIIETVP
ncbi:hypothetical protein AB4876_02685 [Zhongshania guokunii]|uniref:YxeA family protein n=1 Tax=Zhongshania guokunii TaxID=641783 RepID=A0ABV3U3E9_9GAMM